MIKELLDNEGKEQIDSIQSRRKEMNKVIPLNEYLKEVRIGLLTFKKYEFSIEMVMQLSLQIVMLLLSRTITPTHTGLEAVFEEDFDTTTFLVLSVLWSFNSAVRTYVKIRTENKKNFLPFVEKIILGLRAMIFTISRVGCLVAFFCPYLGLLDLLAHWEAERIPLNYAHMNRAEFVYYNHMSDMTERIPIEHLYRSDYKDPE